jgi:MraZ protein
MDRAMTQFLGTHVNKLDRKDRVSVPAPFRSALERIGAGELVLRRSHTLPCIEAWPRSTFEDYANHVLGQVQPFTPEHDDVAAVLFEDAHHATPDAEGRLVLRADLIAHAGLTVEGGVKFVARGKSFQIWDPGAAERQKQEAGQRVNQRGLLATAGAGRTAPASGPQSPLNTTPGDVA